MESDLQQHPPMFLDHHHHHHHQHQHQQMNSGLTRFRSAPSSYFSNIIDKEFYDSIFNNKPSSPETERIFARFMNSLSNDEGVASASATEPEQDSSLDNKNLALVQQQQIPVVKQEVINNNNNNSSSNLQPQALAPMNNETVNLQQQQQQQQRNIGSNYGSSGAPPSQSFYQSSGRPPLPNQMKTGRGNASNLIRHGSSPAGLFSNINIEGYAAAIRGMGTMGAGSNKTSEDASFSPATRLKKNNAQGYSSSGLMSPIAEIRNTNNTESEAFGESQQQGNDFISGLPVSSWDDSSSMISDNITGLKRYREEDVKPFSALNPAPETQNETGGGQGCAAPLSHQLSMPNTSAEIAAIEKFLNCSSDSVVCKIRAKRGCATHPRSIAERVRRTKISERMRKLQDLVPNMDKQTNTADMLDLAVEYIKDLQKQVETLSDSHAKCTCSHKQQHQ